MKQAYVTCILPIPNSIPTIQEIREIDKALSLTTRDHEIILISIFDSELKKLEISGLTGPLSIVYANSMSTKNSQMVAALGRAVGDFIIVWQGDLKSLSESMIIKLLEPTSDGFELVEFESTFQSKSSQIFYKFANSLRSSRVPIRKPIGRTISRRSLGQLLSSSQYEPQMNILFAELPVRRSSQNVSIHFDSHDSLKVRMVEAMAMLSKGSRFGTVIPLALAVLSAFFGILVALYASLIYILSGKSPEGWTTLMVVTGLGQASILGLLGMTWSRIDALSKGFSRNQDATAEVVVIAPQ